MTGTITLPVNIDDEYGIIVGKLKHDNFNHPIELIIYKNTIGDIVANKNGMGSYKIVSDAKFPPDRTWIAKPNAGQNRHIDATAIDQDHNEIEFNVEQGLDLNGYIDFEIRIYP